MQGIEDKSDICIQSPALRQFYQENQEIDQNSDGWYANHIYHDFANLKIYGSSFSKGSYASGNVHSHECNCIWGTERVTRGGVNGSRFKILANSSSGLIPKCTPNPRILCTVWSSYEGATPTRKSLRNQGELMRKQAEKKLCKRKQGIYHRLI